MKRKCLIVSALFAVLCIAQTASAWYAPSLQRWINRDPINEIASLTPNIRRRNIDLRRTELNLHEFVGNDPISNTDLLGLDIIYWPPRNIEGNCSEREKRECKDACFKIGLVAVGCTVQIIHTVTDVWSNGIETHWTDHWWRIATCRCKDPRSCPPPPPNLGKGRNDPPPIFPPRW